MRKTQRTPVSVEKMSSRTLNQVSEFVGFSIQTTEAQTAYKLSQNRVETDCRNIIRELEKSKDSNSIGLAEEMKKKK